MDDPSLDFQPNVTTWCGCRSRSLPLFALVWIYCSCVKSLFVSSPKASQIALLIHSTAHYPLLVWWQRLPIKVVHHLPIFNEKAATLLVRDFLQFLPGCWVWESLFKVKMKFCASQTICQREKLILNNSTKFHVVLKKVHISSTYTITFWPYQTY